MFETIIDVKDWRFVINKNINSLEHPVTISKNGKLVAVFIAEDMRDGDYNFALEIYNAEVLSSNIFRDVCTFIFKLLNKYWQDGIYSNIE